MISHIGFGGHRRGLWNAVLFQDPLDIIGQDGRTAWGTTLFALGSNVTFGGTHTTGCHQDFALKAAALLPRRRADGRQRRGDPRLPPVGMKSAPFSYERPDSVQEALRILDEHAGGRARPRRRAEPRADAADAPDAAGARWSISIACRVSTRCRVEGSGDGARPDGALRDDREVCRSCPSGCRCCSTSSRYVGDLQVRNRGTIGGSLAQADPTGEMPLACLALDATIVAASVSGTREIPIDDFLVSSYATALEPEEMITEIRFPARPRPVRVPRAQPQAQRLRGDQRRRPRLAASDDGRWSDLRIALGGVNDRAVLAHGARRRCSRASTLEDDAIAEAAQLGARRRRSAERCPRHAPSTAAIWSRSTFAVRCAKLRDDQAARLCLSSSTSRSPSTAASYRRQVEPRMHLADFLRHELGLTGTHIGCEQGVCGNCTVLVDGQADQVLPDVRAAGRRAARDHRRVAGRPRRSCIRCSRRSRRSTASSAGTARPGS